MMELPATFSAHNSRLPSAPGVVVLSELKVAFIFNYIFCSLLEVFINRDLTHDQRVLFMFQTIFFLRCWENHIRSTAHAVQTTFTLKGSFLHPSRHFLPHQTVASILSLAEGILSLILIHRHHKIKPQSANCQGYEDSSLRVDKALSEEDKSCNNFGMTRLTFAPIYDGTTTPVSTCPRHPVKIANLASQLHRLKVAIADEGAAAIARQTSTDRQLTGLRALLGTLQPASPTSIFTTPVAAPELAALFVKAPPSVKSEARQDFTPSRTCTKSTQDKSINKKELEAQKQQREKEFEASRFDDYASQANTYSAACWEFLDVYDTSSAPTSPLPTSPSPPSPAAAGPPLPPVFPKPATFADTVRLAAKRGQQQAALEVRFSDELLEQAAAVDPSSLPLSLAHLLNPTLPSLTHSTSDDKYPSILTARQ
ncbi:hypothetical protein JCM5296_004403 [Sporobolomyces johnsonii]